MKTVVVSLDEETLIALDKLREDTYSRSQLIRLALQEYVARRRLAACEGHERQILANHRDLLDRQARSLVAEQAEL